MSWRIQSECLRAKGSCAKSATSLGDLHRRRKQTQGQFFTPAWVAKRIWKAVGPAIERDTGRTFRVLDNAIGSGRLLEGAPMDRIEVYGVDSDQRCIQALAGDAKRAGFCYHLQVASMADLEARGFDLAVINPPYSLTLSSPNLTPFDRTHFGAFGPNSSALSHEYALEQALAAASIVAAVLPVSTSYRDHPRLRTIADLPAGAFDEEGANVRTAVYWFGPTRQGGDIGNTWPTLTRIPLPRRTVFRFRVAGVNHETPAITLPVTGDPTVEMHHQGRRIVLKYHCGLVQAKVANGLLVRQAEGKRLPASLPFLGSGRLRIDVLLAQPDPEQQLQTLARAIRALGGDPWISPTLMGFYQRQCRRRQRANTPMRRVVKGGQRGQRTITAKQRTFLRPGDPTSPSIARGTVLQADDRGAEWTLIYQEHQATVPRQTVERLYSIASVQHDDRWRTKHEGLNHHFPALAADHRARIRAAGCDWLAAFQEDSLIEGLISPYGYIAAWEQGSGKARLAIALALFHSGRNLIVVESGLLPEMRRELAKLGIDRSLWAILKRGDRPTAKVNITTYVALRQGQRIRYLKTKRVAGELVETPTTKIVRTQAQFWRRRFNAVICDEGGLLANINTQQSRAVRQLAARKLIILDGTPQRNYPRDLLPLSVATAGNGRAHQPFGVRGLAMVEPRLVTSADHAQRGEDAFYQRHVVTQWVTNEFREDLQAGAKREVPRINDLGLFRQWLAPHFQRRLRAEPELASFANCPAPTERVIPIQWDPEHLAHYLTVATEFAHWYQRVIAGETRAVGLVTVLARIAAVQRAANSPHIHTERTMATHHPITSKQRAAVRRISHWVGRGRKVIFYAKSPAVLKRMQRLMAAENIDAVVFSGQQSIKRRADELDRLFRFGEVPVLLSSWVGQRGLNLEQAGAVIFYERHWSATAEQQAIYRTQRPSQRQQVAVEYLHLAGGIDDYCAQLVEWKKAAADAGLDFGDQVGEDEEFLHLDTILHRFCEDVLKMRVEWGEDGLAVGPATRMNPRSPPDSLA